VPTTPANVDTVAVEEGEEIFLITKLYISDTKKFPLVSATTPCRPLNFADVPVLSVVPEFPLDPARVVKDAVPVRDDTDWTTPKPQSKTINFPDVVSYVIPVKN
jgi:hypothetical protein